MENSEQREDSQEEIVDIETIRRETKNILEKRVKEALERYVKNTTLSDVTYSIDTGDESIYTMYASYYFIEETMEIKKCKIIVHRQRWNDPHLEIALCHELGHLENALQSKDKKFLDPTNLLQRLYIEIMADKQAARIYQSPEGKKVVGKWLKYSIKDCINNYKRAADRKATAKSLVYFIIRYVSNALSRKEI